MRQLDCQDSRLDRVEPGIDADPGADVAVAPAIFAYLPKRRGECRIGSRGQPGIAQRTEVLCRVEAEAGDVAEASDGTAAIERAVALRAILDDQKPVAAGKPEDRVEL